MIGIVESARDVSPRARSGDSEDALDDNSHVRSDRGSPPIEFRDWFVLA